MKNKMTKNKGIGLLELLLSLSIIAIILVLATRYYSTANLSRQVNEEFKQLQAIAGAAQSWWDDYGHDFTALKSIDGDLVSKGYLTKEYEKNVWGGAVSVVGTSANMMSITLSDIPPKACNNLFAKLDMSQTCDTAAKDATFTVCVNSSKQFLQCTSNE